MKPAIIRSENELDELVRRAHSAECVALDTEFIWERTYYPILGLVQVGFSEKECYLIDTIACRALSALGAVLEDEKVTKILHDAHQDLVILHRATGALPKTIFDSQCAAGFVGLSATISLGHLVQTLLGVKLSKTETRTNWLRRPLSKRQIAYALNDVRYLPAVRKEILSRVDTSEFKQWLTEELSTYDNPELYREKDSHVQFQRIKGVKRFSAIEMAVLCELASWREERARTEDRPREHIVTDKVLAAIAQSKPATHSALRPTRDFPSKKIRRYGDEIIRVVEKGLRTPPAECPQPQKNNGEDEALNARIDFAMAYIKGRCIARKIDPALIGSRAEITEFVRDCTTGLEESNRLMQGWRLAFIGRELQKLLTGKHAIRLNPSTGLPQITSESDSI